MTTTTTPPFVGSFRADPVHSSFRFSVRHMGVGTFEASFDDVEAQLVIDDEGAALTGAARVGSISIRNPPEFREHVVHGADFFDGANHPEISFRADGATVGEDGEFSGSGELTMRGVTRPVVASGHYRVPVRDPYGGLRTAVDIVAVVDRRDWGMDWQMPLPDGGDALGYEVEVRAHIELVGQDAP